MQHINNFSGGMKRGIDHSIMPQDSYTYMLNGYLVSRDNHGYVITSIKGNTSIAKFAADECPIGSVTFNGVLYIITHKIVANIGSICIYTIKGSDGNSFVSDTMLPLPYIQNGKNIGFSIPSSVIGFSRSKLIEVLAKESYDGSVDLYICDGLNPNIVINTGIDRSGKFTNRKYTVFDSASFLMQKTTNRIATITGSIRTGGNLKPGAYFIYVRYLDNSLNPTPFIAESGPYFIHSGVGITKTMAGNFNEDGARINKSIKINISNSDSNYNKVSIGVVFMYGMNGVLSRDNYLLNKTYTLDSTGSVSIVLSGNNELQDLVLEELYKDNIPLNTCETHIQYRDHYVGANWKSNNYDYRMLKEMASCFIPHAVIKYPADYNHNFYNIHDENSKDFEYIEDEIYPLGVSFLIDGLFKTPVFPICGWFEGDSNLPEPVIYGEYVTVNRTEKIIGITMLSVTPNVETGIYTYLMQVYINNAFLATTDIVFKYKTGYEVEERTATILQGTHYVNISYETDYPSLELNAIDIEKVSGWEDDLYYYNMVGYASGDPTFDSPNVAYIKSIDNKLGLYKFPKKRFLDTETSEIKLRFKHLGLKIEDALAKAYYQSNKGSLPNITAVYIVQGKRQENFLLQGLSIAAISTVGFSTKFSNSTSNGFIDMSEFISFGDGADKNYFPFLDATNKPVFPVMTIHNNQQEEYIQLVSSVSQLRVGNDEEYNVVDNGNTEMLSLPDALGTDNDLFRERNGGWTLKNDLNQLKSKHFGIFSPDILLNKDLNLSSCFIKSVGRFDRIRSVDMVQNEIYEPKKYYIYTYAKRENVLLANRKFWYNDLFPRVLDEAYDDPDFGEVLYAPTTSTYHSAETAIINQNEIIPSFMGFISRMKSIYEVYGKERKEDGTSTALEQFLTSSRTDLKNAGIFINRNKLDPAANNNTRPIIDTDYWTSYFSVFAKKKVYQSPTNKDNQLPYLCSNLSMGCTPYLGVHFNEDKMYNSTDRDLHNAIVNVYKYGSIASYIDDVLSGYDLLNEEYNIISVINDIENNVPSNIFKGDLFSQKVFMRINRWTDDMDDYEDTTSIPQNWEYGWKQGTAMNVYLQCLRNANLRVSTFDSTFMPYEIGVSTKGSVAVTDDFVWRSSSKKYENESWNLNDGYNELKSIYKLMAFDELFYNVNNHKQNRILWSGKNMSGSFVDNYRDFPALQYQDIDSSSGQINKLVKFNSTLFSVFTGSINQHFGEQTMSTDGDSSRIIVGDKTLISDYIFQLADFGTQHKESVVTGDTAVYGVDWNKEKIWALKAGSSNNNTIQFGVEPLETSKVISDIFKWLKSQQKTDKLDQNLMGDIATGIHSAFDEVNKEVLFTFKLGQCIIDKRYPDKTEERTYTLVFNEEFGTFTGFYSYNKNLYIKFDNKLLSFTKGKRDLWSHNTGKYLNIDGVIEPFIVEFIINGLSQEQDVSRYEKEFLSHIINSSPQALSSITWETEYQNSEKKPFINNNEFWSNPEYVEHNWNLPIVPNQNNNAGPNQSSAFNSFEKNSNMRGAWIKVRITYKPNRDDKETVFYIKNLITNFIISFTS